MNIFKKLSTKFQLKKKEKYQVLTAKEEVEKGKEEKIDYE